MRVKVLNFLDYDNGNLMDTFVFTEDADIEEIRETVERIFQEEEGQRPYCDIINERYKNVMFDVFSREEIYW
jgi:predicted transcriptional regulator YdeE